MNQLSGRQRGVSGAMVLFGLGVAVVIAALSKGCDRAPAPSAAPAPLPATLPAALPAPPLPAPAPEASPAPTAAVAHAPGVPALSVHNPCDQPLLLAVSAIDANGSRVNAGFFKVAPGARLKPASRSGPIYLYDRTVHYYTETVATEPVEAGRRDETVADRQVGMKSIELDPPALSTITLECPGATSGRP